MPEANLRRTMLANMVKPAMKSVTNLGMIGLAGTLLVKSMEENNDKK
jgi:hypothetical protein